MEFYEHNKKLFEELRERIDKNPDNTENYLLLGKLYVMGVMYDEAIEIYDLLLQKDPLNIQALINSGSIYKGSFCKSKS